MDTQPEQIAEQIDKLPDHLRREVLDFIQHLRYRATQEHSDAALLSEDVLGKDWLSSEEDTAWQDL